MTHTFAASLCLQAKSSLLNAICGEERVIVCDMNVRLCVYDTHVCCIPVSAGKSSLLNAICGEERVIVL